ncbi:MAG: 2-amino-4-hydroxy-6-hydroxymethyldihydropteridine diphosphokinase [Prevotella sp.]
MHDVIIALGSNVATSHQQLDKALRLCTEFSSIVRLSPVMDTEPIGVITSNFANQMARITTDLTLEELNSRLKAVERQLGRKPDNGIIAIDIDIMQFDTKQMHINDWDRQYIKTLFKHL